ncbi:MAG: hypothetical protein Q7R73_02025 [bacterium]|nr:hypothetical protein [bacterium]
MLKKHQKLGIMYEYRSATREEKHPDLQKAFEILESLPDSCLTALQKSTFHFIFFDGPLTSQPEAKEYKETAHHATDREGKKIPFAMLRSLTITLTMRRENLYMILVGLTGTYHKDSGDLARAILHECGHYIRRTHGITLDPDIAQGIQSDPTPYDLEEIFADGFFMYCYDPRAHESLKKKYPKLFACVQRALNTTIKKE